MTRLVAITSPNAFGDRILRRFAEAGLRLDGLIITRQLSARRAPDSRQLRDRIGRARARMQATWQGWRRWRHLARRISIVDSPGDPWLRHRLAALRPDIVILASTGILPADLLSIPAVLTLNAHPGLLPWVRGVCPLENAVLRGVPLGVSVHAVDAGIDTGPIARRVLLPVGEGEADRLALSVRLDQAAADTLVDVVGALVRGDVVELRPQSSRHPYGRWVSNTERERAVALLSTGEAYRLYKTWRDAAGGDVLPVDDRTLPDVSTMSM